MPQISKWLRALTQSVTFLSLAMIALVWFAVEFNLASERINAERAATQSANNLARLFEEHVTRTIADIDKSILFLRAAFERDPEHFDLRSLVANQYFLADLTLQVAMTGPDGLVIASNLGPVTERIDLSDREHVRIHAQGRDDILFISKPVLGRVSGKWSVQITRRLRAQDGGFGGVIVVSLDPFHLSRFYESIDIGKSGAVYLVGRDGILRAQAGLGSTQIGSSLANSNLFRLAMGSEQGVYRSEGLRDGVRRITAYRSVARFPLLLAVGLGEDEVFGPVNAHAVIYRGAAGAMTLVLLMVIAIGARHRLRIARADRELSRSEARTLAKSRELEVTLEHMSQGIMMVDKDNIVAVMNHQAAEILGLPERFATRRVEFQQILDYQWVTGEFGDDGSAVPPDVRDFIRSGGVAGTLTVYERDRPDGTSIEVRSAPLPDGGFVRTYTDITKRKREGLALAEALDKAEAASRARSAFLATMSHEIRTPLNGIVGMASLLSMTKLDEAQQGYLATIGDCSDALLEVINDVLDFTKLDSGILEIEMGEVDLAGTLEAAMDMVRPRAAKKGLAYELVIAPGVPPLARTDGTRMRQVVLNLLSNAVKFTEKGLVRLTARAEHRDGACSLRIEVEDSGIGIPDSARERMFQEFSQVDATITRRFGGTGLGLAISKRIIGALKGTIGFDSTPGEGSRFWFEIPVEAVDGAVPAPVRPAIAQAANGPSLRILLAEDNTVNQEVAAGLLRKMGHQVDIAGDGAAAVEACRSEVYDAVFMDMQMPVMDGLAAAAALRALEGPASRVPIVGLTANAFVTDRQACLDAGMDFYLTKPVDHAKLKAMIAKITSRLDRAAKPKAAKAARVPKKQQPVIDRAQREELERHLGVDITLGLLRTFWSDATQWLRDLDAALNEGDAKATREKLHHLEGSASNLGYSGIVAALHACRAADGDGTAPSRLALKPLADALQTALLAERDAGFDFRTSADRIAA